MQLAGHQSNERWVITVGKFSVTDIFDNNQYAHDPKSNFLNWAAVDTGTFDYAADAWGYTVGIAAERYHGAWVARVGWMDLSNVPNSPHLEPGGHEFELLAEVEHQHTLWKQPGKWLITAYDNRGRMALLNQAVATAEQRQQPIDLSAVRHYRSRTGLSASVEQSVSEDLGLFARLGKASGNVEAYDFTEIDQTIGLGMALKGTPWSRPMDTVGLVGIVNGISAARQQFLQAGGLGLLVGDGQLPHPASERILESYYSAQIGTKTAITLDAQLIKNPGYNSDRGPAPIYAIRLHSEF
jgi:high affinity Mn2+ porin